jgi:hypothetical protein
MNWVYSTKTEKPKQVIEHIKPKTGFFSSLFGLGSSTPQRTPSPLPPQPAINEAEYLKVGTSSVVLTIFTAEVDVKLNQKLSTELHRSTKKNPPRALKYELIYVGRPPLTLAIKGADVGFRRERMSTMQARKRITLSPRQQAVFSRAYVQIWTGECDYGPCILLLTLSQVWFRSHIYRQSCDRCNGIIAHLG